jgi:hypothetical protein
MAHPKDRATKSRKTRSSFRKRDYKLEYQKRIARNLARGMSYSAARGHPRAADLPPPPPRPIDHKSPLERALKRVRQGETQAAAARAEAVSVEGLRRHRLQHTTSRREGRRLIVSDGRPQAYPIVTQGKMIDVVLRNDDGTSVSAYWRAVDKFLNTNDVDHLDAFEGEGVTDVKGRFHRFETRPNVLRKLDSIGELNFIEIYSDTV